MKKFLYFIFLLTLIILSQPSIFPHCEVPCGIYNDEMRFTMITEHIKQDPLAVQKGMEIITESLMIFVKACIRLGVDGFYAYEDPAQAGTLPYYCLTCPEPSSGNHNQVPENSWFLYDSPNLMELDPPELRPVMIKSVRVYASGHSYESTVTDVELLAQE